MPIMLDNLQSMQPVAKNYSPKFFDKELTGQGKSTGVLNQAMNPVNQGRLPQCTKTVRRMKHIQYTNGNTSTRQIPLATIFPALWNDLAKNRRRIRIPDVTQLVKAGTIQQPGHTADIYLKMEPCHVCIETTRDVPPPGSNMTASTTRRSSVLYSMKLFFVRDPLDPMYYVLSSSEEDNLLISQGTINSISGNIMLYTFSNKPIEVTTALAANFPFITVNQPAVDKYLANYELYPAVCACSEEWQSTIDMTCDTVFETFPMTTADTSYECYAPIVARMLRYLENYGVPLDVYRKIYDAIRSRYPQEIATVLCKQNLNLLLSDTLNELDANKASLSQIPAQPVKNATGANGKYFNPDQQRALSSTSPLTLVQSAAGTGKSSVILGRIDHMVDSGVNPNDIMVLSFTNAAADHIKERNPNIHSMTIAKMIHTIYSVNYPTHELSTLETIINSLGIYFPTDDVARQLAILCQDLAKNAGHSFTTINNFIEANFNAVIKRLDAIQQTSLELEIMICYQNIENLVEPPEVQSRHLIIDEVQDNSVFEFIYVLKYVNKHKESLFLVGDCSQTLYEFRASDPRALNVLEASGVFDSFQLQVNYRSNQEILDFANIALANIEANQYANLKLRANSMRKVTEASFLEKVKLKYYKTRQIGKFTDTVPTIVACDLRRYIQNCLDKGEQVAVLAYERRMVSAFGSEIESIWPNAKIVSLMPNNPRRKTFFSTFIRDHWDEVRFMPTKNITDIIVRAVMDSIAMNPRLSQKQLAIEQQQVAKWLIEWQGQVARDITTLQTAYMNGAVSFDDFMQAVKKSMLEYEINKNAISSAILSQKNRDAKEQNNATDANFILSTIHSAKGLEFQNVIVIYRNDRTNDGASSSEEHKRMYYVALTRAMNTEFIVAYDTVEKPAIETHYKNIVAELHKIAPKSSDSAIARAKSFLALAKNNTSGIIQGMGAISLSNTNPLKIPNNVTMLVDIAPAGTITMKTPTMPEEMKTLFHVSNMDALIDYSRRLIEPVDTRTESVPKETENETEEMDAAS